MKWISTAVGLGLALMLGSAAAAAPRVSQVYLADVEAELELAADGSVASIELTRTPALQGEVGDRLQERMRGWRFSVADEDAGGKLPSRTHVSMMLEAHEVETGRLEVRMGTPSFSAHRIGDRPRAEDFQVEGQRIDRVKPRWPKDAAQTNARIEILVEYDASGKVVRAGARRAQLLGVTVAGSRQASLARDLLQPFVREAERALSRWRFPPAAEGQTDARTAVVPVFFRTYGSQGTFRKWELASAVHSLERDWAQPRQGFTGPAPQAVPEDDLSFGLVRLLDSIDGELL